MTPLRIGILGCGPRATTLAQTIDPIPGVRVVALCDRFEARIGEVAALVTHGRPARFTDHRRMLAEAEIDAVYVVVEPENIPNLVIESLEAGKHVISEVPMAYSIEEIWRIVLAVEKSGLVYAMGESTRYWPFINEWKRLREDGTLGEIVYAEGQYMHGMNDDRYYQDPKTGARITIEAAAKCPDALKSRAWRLTHPILYLPHELSPLLRVLDDRITEIVCMGNRGPSKRHPFFPNPDIETALMRTEKDTVLRLSAGFTVHQARRKLTMYHWYNVVGTKGSVETHRSDHDKMKLLIPETDGVSPREVWYDFDPKTTPPEALKSGHYGLDYWAVTKFADAVVSGTQPDMDVYRAAESAAPAIVAAQSAEEGSACLRVPDFRPGKRRKTGERPVG
jgi:predicted dehydrogenase